MLVRFIVSNFLSFGEEVEFNMLVGPFKTHQNHIHEGPVKTLRSAAIYGANGAGKSNLIKALEFLQDTVHAGGLKSSIDPLKFKLNRENMDRPVSFEIEFVIAKKMYAYGVSFVKSRIVKEWLVESGVSKDDKLIFNREVDKTGKVSITVAPKYYKSQKQKLLIELIKENLLKNNELFLCKDEVLKIKEITDFKNKITEGLVVIHPQTKYGGLVRNLTTSNKFRTFANNLLETFDTGVCELGVENVDFDKYFGEDDEALKSNLMIELSQGHSILLNDSGKGVLVTSDDDGNYVVKKVISNHIDNHGEKIAFELDEESDGTQRLLDFIPAFNAILEHEVTYVIDEVDQSLHPALLKALMKKIMDEETVKGQLIFTTHESNLLDLDIFRQDEIWFVEKGKKDNSSKIYSLSEYKPRYDLDIRKGYLKGRFGAIPFLANLEELNWGDYDS